jgi:hypothetical protein
MTACAECEASLYPNIERFARYGPSRDLCRNCLQPAERVYKQLGITVHKYGDWLTPEDRDNARRIAQGVSVRDVRTFTVDGLALGEHAYAGALRFFASGAISSPPC